MNVAASRTGSYKERACARCFKGLVYDGQRGAWTECETCLGTGRAVVYVSPRPKRRLR